MEKVRLGDIYELLNGYAFKSNEYVESGIRIIRITNVQSGYIEDNDPRFYTIQKQSKLKKYMLKENDLLISLTGNVGRVALLDKKFLPAALNQRVACLRANDQCKTNIRYLYHLLSSNIFMKKCINSAQGIAQKNMSTEWLKDYKLNLPNLTTQIKIANQLDKVQEIIDIRKKQIEDLDSLVKSQFIYMFGDPKSNNKNWNMGMIKDLVYEVKYGTSKPSNADGKYKYLRMCNITYQGKLDLKEIKYIDVLDQELEKCIAKKGDVLFNRTNSRELVGKTCVYNIDEKMVIAGFIIRVRVNKKANSYFLSEYINTKYMKKELYNMCKNASGQSNINAQELQNIKIYIPPIELQNHFAEIVKQIDIRKDEIEEDLKQIIELQNCLMNTLY